jgi:putative SOS response-associated peptidase YedK
VAEGTAANGLLQLYCFPMCGRFRLSRASKLAERFAIEPDDDWVPRYNIAPTQSIPVIRQHAEEPKRLGSQMRWGLIPFWAKDATIGYKMITARAETVATKPAFRRYAEGVVWARAFLTPSLHIYIPVAKPPSSPPLGSSHP